MEGPQKGAKGFGCREMSLLACMGSTGYISIAFISYICFSGASSFFKSSSL